MSKIGERPIMIKDGVSLSQEGRQLLVRGPQGEIRLALPEKLAVEIEPNQVRVRRLAEDKKTKAMHGTLARLIANAIFGTTAGFSKELEIVGTGYRAQMEGETLVLFVGYSHPVRFVSPPGITLTVQENKIKVSGIDKDLVGRTADKIKKIRKPDAYKGKGIRFLGEKLRLKPGKAAAAKAGVAGGK
ncbi:MAG TPA: 50S ribosomal protein L6 [Patescibacteria group bacterium]|nr:50S ribosomal protein L6 [Patescibacteria group bacterium]